MTMSIVQLLMLYFLYDPRFGYMISLLTVYVIVYIPVLINYEISMLSAKIGERRKQVAARYNSNCNVIIRKQN